MNWKLFFDNEMKKPYFEELKDFVENEYKTKIIYPKKELIFNAFKLTPFENVKIVIIGQDPYYNPCQAMGLAFSVPSGVKIPKSLANIYKEIGNEFHQEIIQDGDLEYLAKQGVLLLNTILTVEKGKPLSHKNKGYEILNASILKALNDDNSPKVFMLWGNNAKKFKSFISNKKHLVLEANHPSPLSAYHGFFNCNHFIKANDFLRMNHLSEIKWIKEQLILNN